jgi:hypothetical protein
MLAICFSGASAETVEEPTVCPFQGGQEFGWQMGQNMSAQGIGKWDEPSNENPGENPLGIGKWDEPSNENPGQNPLGIGKWDEPSNENPGQNPLGIGKWDEPSNENPDEGTE